MQEMEVYHNNTRQFIYAKSRHIIVFRVQVNRSCRVKKVKLVYWSRTNEEEQKIAILKCERRDSYFDYYQEEVKFSKIARYQRYYFEISFEGRKKEYLTMYGIQRDKPKSGYFEYLYTNEGDIKTVPDWANGIIYYQIFPERFCNGNQKNDPEGTMKWGSPPTRDNFMGGDLRGIINKIDYLERLKIGCIYLNPVFLGDFNHKYATTDYYQIDPCFGMKEELKELVERCHERNIRIILDGVFNHTGTNFFAFQDLLEKQEKSEYKDWFYITEYPVKISHHNYECVGAYKWMPKLNSSNPNVREYIIKVMDYWIKEFHIDGWRLDVSDEVDLSVWQEARLILKSRYPQILLLGETWMFGEKLLQGDQLDSIMNYIFLDAMKEYFACHSIDEKELEHRLNLLLTKYHSENIPALYNLLDSHDTVRFLTQCKENKKLVKMAVAFQMMFIGAPAIYYGDEIGISGENDPDCRKTMIWEESEQDREMLEWYRKLAAIRISEECVRDGNYHTVICDEKNHIFAFERKKDAQAIYVVFNKSEREVEKDLPVTKEGWYRDVLNEMSYRTKKLNQTEGYFNEDFMGYQGFLLCKMQPYSIQIFKKENGGKRYDEK